MNNQPNQNGAPEQRAPAFCIYCGNKHQPGDKFCRKCGKPIQASSTAFCIYCGNKHQPGDTFCRKCGKKVQGAAPTRSPEEINRNQYESAVRLMEASQFDEAHRIFTKLADYNDSKDKAEVCLQRKEAARIESLYSGAVAVLSKQRVTDAEIKRAIEALSSMPDYKDSKEKLEALEALLKKWYADKAAALEAERIRKAKAKAKARKITLIACLSVLVVGLVVWGIIFVNKTYSIVYELDGGEVSVENETSHKLLTNDIALVEPVKEGYTFIGWTGTGLDDPTTDLIVKKWSIGDREYTANWEANTYTVTLDNAGGMGEESITVTYDNDVVLPTPAKKGYSFLGWYSGSTEYTNGTWKDASDVKLTASWEANDYTVTLDSTAEYHPDVVVTFDYNCADLTPTTVTLENGEILAYPEAPTREGYAFAGWYTDSECTVRYNFIRNISEDMTVYAKWEYMTDSYATREYVDIADYDSSNKKSFSVSSSYSSSQNRYYFTCYSQGSHTIYISRSSGSIYASVYNQTQDYTEMDCEYMSSYSSYESVTFSANAGDVICVSFYLSYGSSGSGYFYMTDSDYPESSAAASTEFDGYVYDSTSNITEELTFDGEYEIPTPTRRGYTFLGWYNGEDKVDASGIWSISSDVTLTAKWEVGGNTLTLDANGGTVSEETVGVVFDSEFTLPTPEKTGYAFDGWFCGDKEYVSGVWSELEDVTLVAQWTAIEYSITFEDITEAGNDVVVTLDYNYTDSTPTTVTLANGQTLSYPTVPTRDGYAFAGWYTDSECTNPYSFSGEITADMTLYARWASMTSSYYTREYADIANYNSSSSKFSFSISSSSSSSAQYVYFTCYESGEYTIYFSRSSGDFYAYVYNVTQGTIVMSNYNLYSSYSSTSTTINANAGDVFYVRLYNYYSYSTSSGTFYLAGASYPASSATAKCYNVEGYVYEENSSFTQAVTYNGEYTLPTPTRTGYTFLGWYDGDTKIESGVWTLEGGLTLTAKWEAQVNTVTLDANGGTVSATALSMLYGCEYTLPTPERTGYTFNGWYSGGQQYVSGIWYGSIDVTLVAQWTANTYNVTFEDVRGVGSNVVVTLDYNYSGSTSTSVTLSNNQTLSYPAVPTRSGYAFAGWYTDSSCTLKFNFNEEITSNITLYAKWQSMTSSYSSRNYIDIANYNSSYYTKSFNVSSSYSSSADYYYFTCYETGTYTLHLYRSTGDFFAYVYNVTQGTLVMSNYNLYSSYSSTSTTINANAGDVIYVRFYNYYSYSTSSGYFYLSGASYPASTAKAKCGDVDGYVYDSSSSESQTVTFGDDITLPTPTRDGYTFAGWYNGATRVDFNKWNIASDVVLYPAWE